MPAHRPARSDRFSSLLDRMGEGYLELDGDWRIVECNAHAAIVLDADRERALGSELWTICPDLLGTSFESRIAETMDAESSTTFDVYWPALEATYRVRAYPTDGGGAECYLRRSAAQGGALGEANRALGDATIVEALSDGVLVVDDEDCIGQVNEALTALLDTGRESLVGTHVDVLSTVTKLTSGDVRELSDGLDHVRTPDVDDHRIQLEFPGPDGRPGLVEVRLSPLPDGERIVCAIRDVTERRDRERVIRAMHAATRELFRVDDPMEACAAAVHTGADLLDLQISGIWLFDEERNRLEPVAATAGAHDTVGGLPVFGSGEGLAWEAYQRGEALCFDDVREQERAYNADTPIRSELIVPIGSDGVLMAGDKAVAAFDESDVELAEILAANTEVALERLQHEQLLEDRATELERHNERLESLEGVLSGPILAALADIEATFDSGTIDDARAATERARQLVDVAATYANRPGSTGARTGITLGEALDAAVREAGPTSLTTVVHRDGTLRADANLLQELLAAIVRSADERDADVIGLGVLRATSARPRRLAGFSIEDDGDRIPRRVRTPPFDPYAGDVTVGLELELARLLARDHGWELTADPSEHGMRFEITDVTTLSPTKRD